MFQQWLNLMLVHRLDDVALRNVDVVLVHETPRARILRCDSCIRQVDRRLQGLHYRSADPFR
jgi:hypothetical protein